MAVIWTILMIAAAPVPGTPPAQTETTKERPLFDQTSMEHLRFLEGRWSGTAPDGKIFYEAYDRPDAATLRSRRYDDAGFTTVTDGSVVVLKDAQVTSTWGEYSWRASSIADGHAVFVPVDAPSILSWRRVDADTVEVTQAWADGKGVAQSYALTLSRVR